MHLHIENTRSLGEVFEVTKKRLREALLGIPKRPTYSKSRSAMTETCMSVRYARPTRFLAGVLTGATWRSVRHGSNGCMLTARE